MRRGLFHQEKNAMSHALNAAGFLSSQVLRLLCMFVDQLHI